MVKVTINARPTAPTVALAPDLAFTEDDLVATASGSVDPDSAERVTHTEVLLDRCQSTSLSRVELRFDSRGLGGTETYVSHQ